MSEFKDLDFSKHDGWQGYWDLTGKSPGFHIFEINPYLVKYLPQFFPDNNFDAATLVPLCGKSKDLMFLSKLGMKTVGIEFVQNAIDQLAQEEGFEWKQPPTKTKSTEFVVHEREDAKKAEDSVTPGKLQLWQGDFFKFKDDYLQSHSEKSTGSQKPFKFAFDRASFVAIQPDRRAEYAATMSAMCESILLVTFHYAAGKMEGPPFSVSKEDVHDLYKDEFTIELLETVDIGGKIFAEELDSIFEYVFKLTPKT